ncbi:MAG: AEC family transporter, partial [Pseudomonadota bacterium]
MNLVLTVFEVVAPVFLLAAIGYGWMRLGVEYRVQFVTRLAMTLSVPCLIFTSLMQTEIDPQALTTLSLASCVAYGLVTVAIFVALKVFRADLRTFLAPMIMGNTGNLGLPLALFAFGEVGLGYAVVVFAIMAIYSFTFGLWVTATGYD